MPNWRFWERPSEPPAPAPTTPRRTAPAGETVRPSPEVAPVAPDPQRLAALLRRREGMAFDVEQSEQAHAPENPWRERIALLRETIQNVEREAAQLARPLHLDRPPFPAVPVSIDAVAWEDPASVSFTIGEERFAYESEIDWAERGTYVSRNELQLKSGDDSRLIPSDVPIDLQEIAHERLTEALFIFASDLRRRAEEDEALPSAVTLADLLSLCPVCGDWQAWGGYCPSCTARAQQQKVLANEIARLTDEANAEEEDRAKLADRLPIARRRLAEVEADIAQLQGAGERGQSDTTSG